MKKTQKVIFALVTFCALCGSLASAGSVGLWADKAPTSVQPNGSVGLWAD